MPHLLNTLCTHPAQLPEDVILRPSSPHGCSQGLLAWFGVCFVWVWEGVVSFYALEERNKQKRQQRGIKIINLFTLK